MVVWTYHRYIARLYVYVKIDILQYTVKKIDIGGRGIILGRGILGRGHICRRGP